MCPSLAAVCRRSLALYVWARWCDWAPATPPRSFILSSISRIKKDESDTPEVAWTQGCMTITKEFKYSARTEITVWNLRGYLSSPSREGFALCFITARAARAEKKNPTHKDADLTKKLSRAIWLLRREENRNTYVSWTKPFRFVFAREKRWDSLDLKTQPRHR